VAAATAAFSGKVSPTEQHSGDPSMTPSRRSTRRGMGTGQRRSSFAAVGSGSSQTVLATTSANGRGLVRLQVHDDIMIIYLIHWSI
jgi:hypothetical protein